MNRADCIALDATDKLSQTRDRFELPDGVIYLDGNSLGPLPKGVSARMQKAINEEWRNGLIRSWNDANWHPMPQTCGGKIARLIGAKADEVIVCDSTSINLYKLAHAALADRGARDIVIVDGDDFPTDIYIVESVAAALGCRVQRISHAGLAVAIEAAGDRLACVALTQVNFRTGRLYDMADVTKRVHEQGAKIVWDLSHSAGVVDIALNACDADYAVGCGYKYLNGGPGAPAYAFVATRHHAALRHPLHGWHGHLKPFDFNSNYVPAPGVNPLLVGTSPQLSLIALDSALDAFHGVSLADVRWKSIALGSLFIALVDERLGEFGFTLATPRDPNVRGSQVSIAHPNGYAIVQALIDRGVIGDFRSPDILRFGFAPMYVRYVDVWDAVEVLADVMRSNAWNRPQFLARKAVT